MVLWEFPDEIRKYFESRPRLGVHGHVATDEQYEFMVSKGGIEHSIETEVEDALIIGEMLKYFGVSLFRLMTISLTTTRQVTL